MQNKQALIGIVAAAAILLGAGGLFLLNKNKTATQPSTTSATNQTSNQGNTISSSIQDLFASSENRKCDFEVGQGNNLTKGTVYAAGGTKAYGNFEMMNSGKSQKMYVIRNGDAFYMWGSSLPTGIKMMMSVNEMSSKMSGAQYGSFNANQKTNFNCSGWTVDEAKFTPPSNVNFMDMGNVTAPTGATPNTTGASSSCNICNSLTGAAKTACLTTYHCQ